MDDEFSRLPVSRFVPPRHARSVPRPAVCDALAHALDEQQLVLLVAPGGSGKTTAMSWGVAEVGPRPVVWARCESQDDDPLSAAGLLLAALRFAVPGSGRRLEQVLSVGGTQEVDGLAVALANDLSDVGEPVLALDDLHTLASAETLRFFDVLVDGLPPGARVVVASRTEPPLSLARRRVRGELAEFRAQDLRIGPSTVRTMLDRAGVGADVSEDRIVDYSGGWAAAVRLAVMQVAAGRGLPSGTGPALAPGAERDVDDFLTQEILSEIPEHLRSFLLETALLPELTPETCAAVTGREDSARLLVEIARRDLFVTAFGPDSASLRYHDLFAAFLRRTLESERARSEVDDLRRRAASCSPAGDALRLLLEAGDEDGAAEILSRAARAQSAGEGPSVPDSWPAAIPVEVRSRHPWAALAAGLAHVRRGEMEQARDAVGHALTAFREAGDQLGLTEAGFALAEAFAGMGDMAGAQQLLDDLSRLDLGPDDRIRLLTTTMWSGFFAMDWSAVSDSLTGAFALAFTEASEAGRRALALALASEMMFADTGPAWLREQCALLGALLADRASPAGATLTMLDGAAAFLAGDADTALVELATAAAVSHDHGGLGWLDLATDRLRLAALLSTGDHGSVDAVCEKASRALGSSAIRHQERGMYAYALARSALIRGRAADLPGIGERWLGRVDDSDRPDAAVTRMVIDALVAKDVGREGEARDLLEAASEVHRGLRFSLMTGQPLLELAELILDSGAEHEALNLASEALGPIAAMDAPGLVLQEGVETLRRLLETCARAGVHAGLVERVLRLAADDRPARSVVVALTGLRLSPREVEVLRRVAAGDSNRAIGEALFIGERTVKTHMTSLMRKLGVSSRTQAAAAARDLGLSS